MPEQDEFGAFADRSQSIVDRLGEREVEILRQLAAGATTEEIAANLNLSPRTVQNGHHLVKAKTGLDARRAVACGLVNL